MSSSPAFLRNALVLGLLTAIGPFAIDMYLPSLPSIGASLGAGQHDVVLTLTSFFITFSLGQLVWGPASDMYGRKAPIYFGLGLFVVASVGCATAGSVGALIAWRAVQGFAGASSMIVARAMVRDLHSGVDEVRLLSLLMLVFSVSPILAPSVGSAVIAVTGWRGVLWFVAVLGALALLCTVFLVRETRPVHMRHESSMSSIFSACRVLLTDRHFVAMSLMGAFAISGFFVFLANSSFIYTAKYGLSPALYSLTFSTNALSFFAAAQLNGWLGKKLGLMRLVRIAVWGYGAGITVLMALTLAGFDSLPVMMICMFVGFGFLGFMLPVTSVMAMDRHGAIAGTASSLLGTMQMAVGSAVMAISGLFANGTVLPMVGGIFICAMITLAIGLVSLGRVTPALVSAPGE